MKNKRATGYKGIRVPLHQYKNEKPHRFLILVGVKVWTANQSNKTGCTVVTFGTQDGAEQVKI